MYSTVTRNTSIVHTQTKWLWLLAQHLSFHTGKVVCRDHRFAINHYMLWQWRWCERNGLLMANERVEKTLAAFPFESENTVCAKCISFGLDKNSIYLRPEIESNTDDERFIVRSERRGWQTNTTSDDRIQYFHKKYVWEEERLFLSLFLRRT